MSELKTKRFTIKDIARESGVSVATVHCALYNKPGVSDAVKERILKIAHDNDYKVNLNASFLKRRNLRIAAVFPSPINEKRFNTRVTPRSEEQSAISVPAISAYLTKGYSKYI